MFPPSWICHNIICSIIILPLTARSHLQPDVVTSWLFAGSRFALFSGATDQQSWLLLAASLRPRCNCKYSTSQSRISKWHWPWSLEVLLHYILCTLYTVLYICYTIYSVLLGLIFFSPLSLQLSWTCHWMEVWSQRCHNPPPRRFCVSHAGGNRAALSGWFPLAWCQGKVTRFWECCLWLT